MRHEKKRDGFRVLRAAPLTQNERDWIEMLRAIVGDEVPGPTLKAVQALRVTVGNKKAVRFG